MNERHGTGSADGDMRPLIDDDTYLTHLSQQESNPAAEDELGRILFALRSEVERDIPPTPDVDKLLSSRSTSLDAARQRRSRPLLHGLIGAAAASVVLAGSAAAAVGTGLVQGPSEDATAVELASTLDAMQASADDGNINQTRDLLDDARRLVARLRDERDRRGWALREVSGKEGSRQADIETVQQPESPAKTVTTTVAPPVGTDQPQPKAEPTTVTVTQTETVTETQRPVPEDSAKAEPQPEPASKVEGAGTEKKDEALDAEKLVEDLEPTGHSEATE